MDWALAVLLVVAVVAMIVVPYFRASPAGPGQDTGALATRAAIEEALRQRYCLACGTPFEKILAPACQNCGAAREEGSQ